MLGCISFAMQKMTAKRWYNKIAPNIEVHMKQKCATEFLHVGKTVPINIHWQLLNVYEDQTGDVITVRWWMVPFSNGNRFFTSIEWRLSFITGKMCS